MGNDTQSKVTETTSSEVVHVAPQGMVGVDVSALQGVSQMAEQSRSALQLKKIINLSSQTPAVQRIEDLSAKQVVQRAGDGPDPSVSVSLDQDMFLLQGNLTTAARFKGFLGMESTFSKLQKVVEKYRTADGAQKEALKPEIIRLGKEWSSKHRDSQDPNDQLKLQSIERIISALETRGASVKLATISDKVTTGTRIKEAITGKKSTLQEIEPTFAAYEQEITGTIGSVEKLYGILQKAEAVKDLCAEWMRRHGSSTAPADLEKKGVIDDITRTLGSVNVTVTSEYFDAVLSGISISDAQDGRFVAASAQLTVHLPDGDATGRMTNLSISAGGIDFQSARLSYSGTLGVDDSIAVTAPYIELSRSGSSYALRAGGALSLAMATPSEISSLKMSGEVSVGYDFGQRKFLSPTVDDGMLDITLFKAIRMQASGIRYADGVFAAEQGSLSLDAFGKSVTGTMEGVSYSAADGFQFSSATVQAASSFSPMPGFRVDNPQLTLQKGELGWMLTGSGTFALEMEAGGVTIEKMEAEASVSYLFEKGELSGFAVDKGQMQLSVFNQLTIDVADFAMRDGRLSAASAGFSVTMMGKNINGVVSSLSYAAGEGMKIESAEISSSDRFEVLPGFFVESPSVALRKTETGWSLEGNGRLGIEAGGSSVNIVKAGADVRLVYDIQKKEATSLSASNGMIEATLFNGISIQGDGIGFEGNTLTIGEVAIALNTGGVLGDGLTGSGKGIRISKDGVSWSEIMVSVGKAFQLGKFTLTPPTARVEPLNEQSYVVFLEGAQGEVSLTDWLSASGQANVRWSPSENSGIPVLTGGELAIKSGDIQFPGQFVPGWPLSIGFSALVMAGPVPLTGGVEARLGGGVAASFGGSLSVSDESVGLQVGAVAEPSIELELRVFAGVGSPLLVYVGGYLSGRAAATAKANIGINASLDRSNGYKLDSLKAVYDLGAEFTAKVSAGVDVRALYFFRQDLYEVVIREWNLGNAQLSGEYDLLTKKNAITSSQGLMNSGGGVLPSPDVEIQTRSYGKAIAALYEALASEGVATGKPGILGEMDADSETSESALRLGKEELKRMSSDVVRKSFDMDEIERIIGKEIWLKRQEEKLSKASDSIWAVGKNKEHYRKKIAKGRAAYLELLPKFRAYQAQTALSTSIFAQLDELLDPANSLSVEDVQAQVNQYLASLKNIRENIVQQVLDDEPDLADDDSD